MEDRMSWKWGAVRMRALALSAVFHCTFGLPLADADLPLELRVVPGSTEWREIFEPPYTSPTEIPASAPLRRQLLDQLRPKIEHVARKSVRFEGSLRSFKNWAFFSGRTVDGKGKSVNLPPIGNDDTAALWLRTRAGWTLVDFSGGHSDAFYLIWPEQYGAPPALFGVK